MLLICGLECWHTEKPFGSPDEDFYSGNSVVLRAGAEEVSSSSQLWSTLVSSLVFLWAWAFLASVCLHWAQRLPRALFPHSSSLLLLPTPIPNWALQGQNLQDASGLADIFIPKEPHITFWKSKFLSVLPHSWTHCSADIIKAIFCHWETLWVVSGRSLYQAQLNPFLSPWKLLPRTIKEPNTHYKKSYCPGL